MNQHNRIGAGSDPGERALSLGNGTTAGTSRVRWVQPRGGGGGARERPLVPDVLPTFAAGRPRRHTRAPARKQAPSAGAHRDTGMEGAEPSTRAMEGTAAGTSSHSLRGQRPPDLPAAERATPSDEDGGTGGRAAWRDYQTVFTNAKAGMQGVDREHVQRTVFEMSKGSAHFKNEQRKQAQIDVRIARMKEQATRLSAAQLLAHTRWTRNRKLVRNHALVFQSLRLVS